MIEIIGEIKDANKNEEQIQEEAPEWKLRMMRTFLGSRSNEKNKRDVQKIRRNIVES